MHPLVRRYDVQAGPYAYRVLRPAGPLRGAVLAHDPDERHVQVTVSRRDGGRILRLAGLVGGRTLVLCPMRGPGGRPADLVLVDEALRFPPERWSDVRQRLGTGRIERAVPAPDLAGAAAPRRRGAAEPEVAAFRAATLLYAAPEAFRDGIKLLADGAPSLELGRRGTLSIHEIRSVRGGQAAPGPA